MQKTKVIPRLLSGLTIALVMLAMLPAGVLVGAAEMNSFTIKIHGTGSGAAGLVEGAEVILESAGYKTVSAITASNGNAVFSVATDNAVMQGVSYTYTVIKQGYTTLRSASKEGSFVPGNGTKNVWITIDPLPPVIVDVTCSPESAWTKDPVTVTVNATDNVGIDRYSFDGGLTWQTEKTFTAASNITLEAGTIMVKDTAGHVTAYLQNVVIANIDDIAPVIHDVQLSPHVETNGGVTLEITAEDDRSNAGLEYSIDGGANWSASCCATISSNTVLPENSVMVRDDVGNETAYPAEIRIDKINRLAPAILSVTPDTENTVPTNGAVTIAVAAAFQPSDGYAGSAVLVYSFDGGASWQTENYAVVTENQIIPAGTIQVKDAAGNIAVYHAAIEISNIDTDAPMITNVEITNRDGIAGGWDAVSNTVTFLVPDGDIARVWVQTTDTVDFATEALVSDGQVYSFTVTENQTVYLFAVDLAGNLRDAVPVTVNKIDKTAPVVHQPVKSPAQDWHNGVVEVAVTADDRQEDGDVNGTGVERVVYSMYSRYDAALEAGALQEAVFDASSDAYYFSAPDQAFVGTYYIWAIDQVGNLSEAAWVLIQIDKTAPANPTVSYVKDTEKGFIKELIHFLSFGLFFKDEVTIHVSAQDDESGVAKVQVQLVPIGGDISDAEWMDMETDSDAAEFTVPCDTFAGRLYIRVWDTAGNVTEAVTDLENDTTIVVDNTSAEAPAVVLNGRLADEWTDAWTNNDVTIALSGSECLSGVDYYQYRIDYADPSLPDTGWMLMPDTDGVMPRAEGGTVPNQLTLHTDINARIYFRAVSNTAVAGASSDAVCVKIQKTAPDNAVCALAPTNGRDVEGKDTGWYVGSFDAPHLAIIAPKESPYAPPVKTYYQLWNTSQGELEFDAETVLFSGEQPEFAADGVYMLKIWTVDIAGNTCDAEKVTVQEIKIATALPTGLAITANGVPIAAVDPDCVVFNCFFSTEVSIGLNASFGLSGQRSLMYQKVRNASYFDPGGTWTTYDPATGIAARPNDRFVIYFRAEDGAGNIAILHSDGIILDSQTPEGEAGAPDLYITPESAGTYGFYNGDVTVDISASDPKYLGSERDESNGICAGLERITYRVITDGVVTKAKTVIFPVAGAQYTRNQDGLIEAWSGSVVVAAKNNSNDVVVEATAIDNAGNSRTTRTAQGVIKIDCTNPEINISYDNNQGDTASGNGVFFDAARTATITVAERNFRPQDVVITLTRDGVRVPVSCDWKMVSPGSGNGDDRTYQAALLFHGDGDYTVSVACTDAAGNINAPVKYAAGTLAPQSFSLDQTRPQISVTYDNNAVENGRYFNDTRAATITVTERNFDPARVAITRTASLGGAAINLQTAPVWTYLGNDIYTCTLENTVDGDYVFNAAAEDMAGNRSGLVQYGSSTAPGSFTIDTKFDTLTASGVEDGKFYKDAFAPSIRFQDINFDRYEIKLTRTSWGARNIDVTEEFVPPVSVSDKGGTAVLNLFEKTQENDGIYKLSVTVYDKAGNSKTLHITFTLNRFGSAYAFSEELAELQNNYIKSVDKPLVITEYNPTRLQEDSLYVEIARDGVPLDNVAYSVDPPVSGTAQTGANGWYEYRYTIDPSNFADANGNPVDGVYKIVTSSRDEADNAPETANYSDKIILFRIDNVAPEIASIVGLGSRVINQKTVNVTFEVFDAIGLQKITVFVNDTIVKSFDSFEVIGGFTGEFSLQQGINQNVRIRVEDKAGNVTDTEDESFNPPFPFERNITVSTNLMVRWFANTPVFIGSIVSSALLGGMVWFAVVARKTKKLFG